ncbi:Fc.00g100160.m01.CDS01 [Cosmosporella sp. VM-42]
MFSFDQASLPQITTRKAFIGVDFQNDFLSPDGALPVSEPEGFVDRTIELATAFRSAGDVVWVQSRFDKAQPVDAEQILTSDFIPPIRPSSRSRRRVSVEPVEGPPDEEAFLSHEVPVCAKPDSDGCLMAPTVKDATVKSDTILTKSHYSAFNSTQLLRVLRAKMVMEVFICGSLANVGVYATALDAAGHGMAITIVEDCCGFRKDGRQTKAIRNLIELTGCEVASCEEVIESIQPKVPKPPPSKRGEISRKSPPEKRRKSDTPEIVKNIAGLRLASDSPTPAAQPQPQLQAKASTTSVSASVEQRDSQTTPPSKLAEAGDDATTPGLQAVKEEDVVEDVVKKGEKDATKDENTTETKQQITKNDTIELATTSITPASPPKYDQNTMDNTKIESESQEGLLLQKGLCEGDTDVIENVLPAALADGIFDKLRDEIQWQRMSHQGGDVPRLVAVQGLAADDGSIPVYRHPSDEAPPLLPFTPTVLAIKAETEKHLGHPLNHVLIQYYRDGNDYISEHSDKTLDIVKGSYIANVSLGAERTMVLRTKRQDKDPSRTGSPPASTKRQVQRARLPHNSLCRMGLQTNMKWLHAIRQDKRADRDKSPAELAYNGGRISLTFRQIGTFLDRDETCIWGQGATNKTREEAKPVINGQTDQAIAMLRAFGTENHASDFDWEKHYGGGFDVLHMSNAPRLFASPDPLVNSRIGFMLAECGVNYAKGSLGLAKDADAKDAPVKFVDNDTAKSTVEGDIAIMLYIDAKYGEGRPGTSRTAPELADQYTRFQQGLQFLEKYRALEKDAEGKRNIKLLRKELAIWDAYAAEVEDGFLAGAGATLPDFVVWPVLHALVEEAGTEALFEGFEALRAYDKNILGRESTRKFLASGAGAGFERVGE